MPSHFDDIGFELKTEEQYFLMTSYWMRNSLWRRTQEIRYRVYIPNDNIQVWIFARNGKILNTIPFYNGNSRVEIRIEEKLVSGNNIRGMISAWVNPSSTEDCPLLFDVPDYWMVHERLREGQIYHIRLTAFAEEAGFFEDEESFSRLSPKNIKAREMGKDAPILARGWAPNHFIPTGQIALAYNEEPKAAAQFAGTVKELKPVTNQKTKCTFYWMLVETLFDEIDVVCSEEGLNVQPQVGGILDGDFYLVGRICLD